MNQATSLSVVMDGYVSYARARHSDDYIVYTAFLVILFRLFLDYNKTTAFYSPLACLRALDQIQQLRYSSLSEVRARKKV